MTEPCCRACTEAGRDTYTARAAWHAAEALKDARRARIGAYTALVLVGAVFVYHIVRIALEHS